MVESSVPSGENRFKMLATRFLSRHNRGKRVLGARDMTSEGGFPKITDRGEYNVQFERSPSSIETRRAQRQLPTPKRS